MYCFVNIIYVFSVDFLIKCWGFCPKKLPLHRTDITKKLQELCLAGMLIAEGHGRGCVYRLKTLRLQAQEAKVATSEQAIPHKLSAQQREQLILAYCSDVWRTVQDITGYLGRKKDYLRNKVLPQLTESGKLEMRFPDTPNHPNQQYRTKQSRKEW